jgi:hypothetical protein
VAGLCGDAAQVGLEGQGLTAEEVEDDVIRLSGGQLAEPLFFTRIRDVVVVRGDEAMPMGEALPMRLPQGDATPPPPAPQEG